MRTNEYDVELWDIDWEEPDTVLPTDMLGLHVFADDPQDAIAVAIDVASDLTGYLIRSCDPVVLDADGTEAPTA